TKVLAVKMHDVPGSMHVILESLYKNNISVEYAYAFISRKKENAYIILRVDDVDAVEAVLAKDGIETVSESEVFSL
ncbi:MAG: acetolactate synthase, partial [Clostridiales bacterium]|nr:acetolactate synthase [Clostridiales bacterium]